MSLASLRIPSALFLTAALAGVSLGVPQLAIAAEFSVSPIRVELGPRSMSETITVTNDSATRLRVAVRLMEWTQDASGKDIYSPSADLIYFPRQMDVEPGARRLIRVGAKNPAGIAERAYRLFIEEIPEAAPPGGAAVVSFYFSFGVPIFLPPAVPKPQLSVLEPTLENGKLALAVSNSGNQHFRVNKLKISDGAAYAQEVAGWYSLAGTSRTYTVEIPADACRRAKTVSVTLEGEGLGIERKLDVDPAKCS